MNAEAEKKLNSFLKKVDELLSSIEAWSQDENLITTRMKISISEEDCGIYDIEKLLISEKTGQEIAQIIPISSSVLGANGRVDIKGLYDNAILVELNKGGPTITTTVSDGGEKYTRVKPLYRGIDEDGWYWIERNASSKGRKITRDMFFELLDEVSDYVSA